MTTRFMHWLQNSGFWTTHRDRLLINALTMVSSRSSTTYSTTIIVIDNTTAATYATDTADTAYATDTTNTTNTTDIAGVIADVAVAVVTDIVIAVFNTVRINGVVTGGINSIATRIFIIISVSTFSDFSIRVGISTSAGFLVVVVNIIITCDGRVCAIVVIAVSIFIRVYQTWVNTLYYVG